MRSSLLVAMIGAQGSAATLGLRANVNQDNGFVVRSSCAHSPWSTLLGRSAGAMTMISMPSGMVARIAGLD